MNPLKIARKKAIHNRIFHVRLCRRKCKCMIKKICKEVRKYPELAKQIKISVTHAPLGCSITSVILGNPYGNFPVIKLTENDDFGFSLYIELQKYGYEVKTGPSYDKYAHTTSYELKGKLY